MRKISLLGRVAANAQRQATKNATKAVYMGVWGSTPEADKRKRRNK